MRAGRKYKKAKKNRGGHRESAPEAGFSCCCTCKGVGLLRWLEGSGEKRESERQGWMRGDVTRHAARAAETPGLSRCMRGDSWRNDHHQSNLAEINRYPRARVSDINTTHTHCVAFRFLQIISRRSHTYSHSSDFDACVFIVFLLRRENSTR